MKKCFFITIICFILISLFVVSASNSSLTSKTETNTKSLNEQLNKLTKNEIKVYKEIDKALKNNKSYEIINFENIQPKKNDKGYIKYDLNKDGMIDTLSYEIETKPNTGGYILIKRVKISINEKHIIYETCRDDEVYGSIHIADIDSTDKKIDFYIVQGYLVNDQTNSFFYFDKKINRSCKIETKVIDYFGSGKIYFWEGCIDTKSNYALDKDLVLFHYDYNKRKYILEKDIVGRCIDFEWGNYIYKTKEDVISGAPVDVDGFVKMNPSIIIRRFKSEEKLTVLSIDGLIDGEPVNGYHNNDNGIKVKTSDDRIGWIGGFHMVWN